MFNDACYKENAVLLRQGWYIETNDSSGKQKAKLYDEAQLLKLQMILKYKKAGVSLESIKQMMNESNKIKVQVLEDVIVQMKLDIETMSHRIHYAEKLIQELKENDDETIE